jgi:CBS domain-containing protein
MKEAAVAQTVREVMTAEPTTVATTASVEEAAQLMKSDDIGDVMVVNRNKKLVGILTDRDIVVRAVADGADLKELKVEEVVTKEVKTVLPDAPVQEAVRLMREEAIRRLPVIEEGKLVGIVTLGDLAVDRDPTSALAEISAAPPDHPTGHVSTNGRKAGIEIAKALPAVAFGASVAFAMNQVRGRSRRKTVSIAAKKLRKAGKKLRKAGDEVGAEAASRAAQYVAKASKEIRQSGKKLKSQIPADKVERKVAGVKRRLAKTGADRS